MSATRKLVAGMCLAAAVGFLAGAAARPARADTEAGGSAQGPYVIVGMEHCTEQDKQTIVRMDTRTGQTWWAGSRDTRWKEILEPLGAKK